mmetsp:Transcript_118495/g.221390  ORF Transcript_118495/g.221390 Transcript_118495/m.221390 type:complete len:205 (+) Transcript_118495:95-709(+)
MRAHQIMVLWHMLALHRLSRVRQSSAPDPVLEGINIIALPTTRSTTVAMIAHTFRGTLCNVSPELLDEAASLSRELLSFCELRGGLFSPCALGGGDTSSMIGSSGGTSSMIGSSGGTSSMMGSSSSLEPAGSFPDSSSLSESGSNSAVHSGSSQAGSRHERSKPEQNPPLPRPLLPLPLPFPLPLALKTNSKSFITSGSLPRVS